MATSKRRSGKLRLWLFFGLVLLGLLAAGWIVYGRDMRKTAGAGSAYAARVACSCRFVAGRSLEDCGKDKIEGMALISLSDDPQAKSVTASVPLVASETAQFQEGYGCVLQEWED